MRWGVWNDSQGKRIEEDVSLEFQVKEESSGLLQGSGVGALAVRHRFWWLLILLGPNLHRGTRVEQQKC